MKESGQFNFVGNIEGRDLFNDKADVVVCDGFTGNIVLKAVESFHELLSARGVHDPFFDRLDYEGYGGLPVLGVNGNVMIGHGISNAETIKNLVAKAVELDAQRGDQIEVASMQFQDDTQEEVAVIRAVERQALIDKAVKYGLILLVFLLLVFVVFRPVVRWLTAPPPPVARSS